MSSPSLIRRVEGGGWSKQHRFYDPNTAKEAQTPGPGAPYNLPSLFSEHVQGPIYRAEFERKDDGRASARNTARSNAQGDDEENQERDPGKLPIPDTSRSSVDKSKQMPHPSKDRTAWMIGITKNDLAYYSNIAGNMGPAFYTPSLAQTTEASPRNVFSKNARFMSLTHRYISKEHNMANLCTASPGPKYMPAVGHIDLTARYAPEYSFGGRNLGNRSAFIHGAVKNGYMYTARPATSDPNTNVGPANYAVRTALVQPTAPRPLWSKADRFAPQDKVFISKRHARAKLGLNSPGPMYHPNQYSIAYNLRESGKPAHVPAGKWCP